MGTIIRYETIGKTGPRLKMICNNERCVIDAYEGEGIDVVDYIVEPTIDAFERGFGQHPCPLCKSQDVSPVPEYDSVSELEEQELAELNDQTLREHELRQQDYESMLPFGSRGVSYNDAGEPEHWD